jgi:hypothetical protein
MKTTHEPTELDLKAHDAMMEAMTNLAAHLHMAQGWFDSLLPLVGLIAKHDLTIMPQLVTAMGHNKIAVKNISRKLVKSDWESVDLMYQEMGRHFTELGRKSFEERKKFIDALNSIEI